MTHPRSNRRAVAWVTHFLPYPANGHGALQRTHHLIRRVAEHFDVHLFTLSNEPQAHAQALTLGVQSAVVQPVPTGAMRLFRAAGSLAGRFSIWDALFFDRSLHAALQAFCSRHQPIVIVDTIFLQRYLDDLQAGPIVINHHNIESHLLRQRADRSAGWRASLFRLQSRRTSAAEQRCGDRHISQVTVSPDDSERLRAILSTPSIIEVPNGVDIEYFSDGGRSNGSPRPHSLVFAGGMDWYPNRDAMDWVSNSLWASLKAAEPRRSLTVIGRAPPPSIQALARNDDQVKVTGFVNDVRPYIAEASAYLCPIRQGGGTRLKILDALAMGIPLVATRHAVEGLGLIDGRDYLEANTEHDMHRALTRLDNDPALSYSLSLNGRTTVAARFAWDVVSRPLLELLEELSIASTTMRWNDSA
ncbi:MAG: glycosyltransferase family 4 protein [Gemmatimonas sp.]|jgi:glycosyltransferase involved in cell wall biosynthesis